MNDSQIAVCHQLLREMNPDQRMIMKHILDDFGLMIYFKEKLELQISNDAKEFTFT